MKVDLAIRFELAVSGLTPSGTSNILLGDRSGNSPEQVYLVDFGSVQTVAHGETVTVVGIYGYMPMEQFGGQAVPASDLYSIGRTLTYLLTGQPPDHLSQEQSQIGLRQLTHVSHSFRNWVCWLIEIEATNKPSSALETLEYLECSPTPSSSSKQHFLLDQKPRSNLNLTRTSTLLRIILPKAQILFPCVQRKINWEALGICLLIILFFVNCSLHQWYIIACYIVAFFIAIINIIKPHNESISYFEDLSAKGNTSYIFLNFLF